MNGYATVKDITLRDDGNFLVAIEVGNGYGSESLEFVLMPEILDEIDIRIGEIDGECLCTLETGDAITRAYVSACNSISYSLCSHKALRRKLISKKHSPDAAARAVELVRKRGYINENELALRRAELMVEKLWGRTRICSKLMSEEFDDEAMSMVRDYLEEIDFGERCAEVIAKKYPVIPSERRERDKMYAALLRLGFSSTDIREAIRYNLENE